jgi:transcription elongation factor Elf1
MEATMNTSTLTPQTSEKASECPYCGQPTAVDLPGDYEPVYAYCGNCGEKFIAQRLESGFQVLSIEEAPCCSDPDCREIEMGAGDEE